jgi:hypothetical protein
MMNLRFFLGFGSDDGNFGSSDGTTDEMGGWSSNDCSRFMIRAPSARDWSHPP